MLSQLDYTCKTGQVQCKNIAGKSSNFKIKLANPAGYDILKECKILIKGVLNHEMPVLRM